MIKAGSKVTVINPHMSFGPQQTTPQANGVVLAVECGDALVQFVGWTSGHNGDGRSAVKDCWWIDTQNLKALSLRKNGSNAKKLLDILLTGQTISAGEATLLGFGTHDIARSIFELRQDGHKITTTIKFDSYGNRYASYSLKSQGRVAA